MYTKIIIYAFTVAVLTTLMYMTQPATGFKFKVIALIRYGAIITAMLIAADSFMGDQPIIDVLKTKLTEHKQKAEPEKQDLDNLYQSAVLDATSERL